jgi:ABC-2 type transport system ATP-binding protein
MDKIIIKIQDVSKTYGQTTALHPLSLQVPQKTCLVLCGGNGAGKSTLIQLLAGIISPTSGQILLEEKELWSNHTSYVKQIGYMPDDFQLPSLLTVYEFLSFYASLCEIKKERIEEVLEQVGLADKRNHKLNQLSKGMRQRLLFVQAILRKPLLLLLDEPTNGLDPYWMKQLVQLIDRLKQAGTTIILSTHQLDVAADVGDFICYMHQGKLMEKIEAKKYTKEKLILHLYSTMENASHL